MNQLVSDVAHKELEQEEHGMEGHQPQGLYEQGLEACRRIELGLGTLQTIMNREALPGNGANRELFAAIELLGEASQELQTSLLAAFRRARDYSGLKDVVGDE